MKDRRACKDACFALLQNFDTHTHNLRKTRRELANTIRVFYLSFERNPQSSSRPWGHHAAHLREDVTHSEPHHDRILCCVDCLPTIACYTAKCAMTSYFALPCYDTTAVSSCVALHDTSHQSHYFIIEPPSGRLQPRRGGRREERAPPNRMK